MILSVFSESVRRFQAIDAGDDGGEVERSRQDQLGIYGRAIVLLSKFER